ncbi:4-hydroxythreonine-4-phosphate dehydrogenase PdxA [Fodinibius sediminis]|uniref:4-hydroxythreonine-4-phosphate dehydrogenase n=1 Tax=Fodinibius sediminis TaxID=1214077 RepID=A0A521DAD1_9BACT|nr:4-hydroxythreonine-4-phosphate dehydrogenase PdxA [Fodinibius sediminis]SMO68623.1 4-hydroxythreonine-4-phosphate dehydrogenase [Fodinibius sediminis]
MAQHIVISSGDINGIGPEIILKALKTDRLNDHTATILSAPEVIEYYCSLLDINLAWHQIPAIDEARPGRVNVLDCYDENEPVSITPGVLSKQAGGYAMKAVECGLELCKRGAADAMVTAPISKEAVNRAGYHIPGHTEFLAENTGTKDFLMMLVNDGLRVGLATIHIPISAVPEALNKRIIERRVKLMHQSLHVDFGIAVPRIAVLGLNPHAGDGGIIGNEERDIISPALESLKKAGITASGPYPADGFFGNKKYDNFDGILAMYHDQGLIPFKTLSFGAGVNFTAGLPIIRTSPDHGTAFDIAGKGQADASSFKQALSLAIALSVNRKREASG